jgi:SRSO17 transposase
LTLLFGQGVDLKETQGQETRDSRGEVAAWVQGLDALHARIGRHFVRPEVRQRARRYLGGLLSPIERKNGWQLAEQTGERSPDGMQRLLATAQWDADAVRDDLRRYVIEHLGDEDAVLVVDETGFLKKGEKSVGVQPQYSGTAGKIANCQIGLFLAYASPKGHAFIDRALYLPRSWGEDGPRRDEAGVPETVAYRSKTELAVTLVERALDAGITARWVLADALYGSDSAFRRFLEERRQPYLVALRGNVYLWDAETLERLTVAEWTDRLGPEAWRRVSAGDGAKGPRIYDWAAIRIDRAVDEGRAFWLLARRSVADPTKLAYYYVLGPAVTTLEEMARIAGQRWTIEEALEAAKGAVGLDEYEVRHWQSWYRHVTLALLAHAFLSATRAQAGLKGAA